MIDNNQLASSLLSVGHRLKYALVLLLLYWLALGLAATRGETKGAKLNLSEKLIKT